jgi:hypothetical protein
MKNEKGVLCGSVFRQLAVLLVGAKRLIFLQLKKKVLKLNVNVIGVHLEERLLRNICEHTIVLNFPD